MSSTPHILLVEDEPQLADLVGRGLRSAGYEVTVAGDGLQALQLAEERPVDLVVLDWMLPGMDGISLARHLDKAGFADTPKLAMSASRARLQEAWDSTLFVGALPKPFDVEELFACIEPYLPVDQHVVSANPPRRLS